MNKEVWKDIVGYEGIYKISSFGRVKSLPKQQGFRYQYHENVLVEHVNSKGYSVVCLSNNKQRKYLQVHRLVASSFIPNPNNLPQVNHKDENKLNNRVDNLEWCTAKYNTNYGTNIIRRSSNKKIPVYSVDKYNNINSYDSVIDASRKLNIDCSHIYSCLSGRRKSAYGFKWFYSDKESL